LGKNSQSKSQKWQPVTVTFSYFSTAQKRFFDLKENTPVRFFLQIETHFVSPDTTVEDGAKHRKVIS
jgi:hypothetical protein